MFNHSPAEPTAGGFALLPDGVYELKVIKTEEKRTEKEKYPMVKVECEVYNNPDYNGKIIFHNVTFMPKEKKGSGMSTHFLKCIQQPWEGNQIAVDPEAWVGATFKATIGTREYEATKGKNIGKMVKSNDIKEINSNMIPF